MMKKFDLYMSLLGIEIRGSGSVGACSSVFRILSFLSSVQSTILPHLSPGVSALSLARLQLPRTNSLFLHLCYQYKVIAPGIF